MLAHATDHPSCMMPAHTTGPCLTLLRGLRIPPEALLSWMEGRPFLKRHIHSVFFFPHSSAGSTFSSRYGRS